MSDLSSFAWLRSCKDEPYSAFTQLGVNGNTPTRGLGCKQVCVCVCVCMCVCLTLAGTDTGGIQNRLGVLFFCLLYLALMTLSSLPVWRQERLLYLKERDSGAYDTPAYFSAVSAKLHVRMCVCVCVRELSCRARGQQPPQPSHAGQALCGRHWRRCVRAGLACVCAGVPV